MHSYSSRTFVALMRIFFTITDRAQLSYTHPSKPGVRCACCTHPHSKHARPPRDREKPERSRRQRSQWPCRWVSTWRRSINWEPWLICCGQMQRPCLPKSLISGMYTTAGRAHLIWGQFHRAAKQRKLLTRNICLADFLGYRPNLCVKLMYFGW